MSEYPFSSELMWIYNFSNQLKELKTKQSLLDEVDLVVEGGVGYGKMMKVVISQVFPKALYVGMDLASIDSHNSQIGKIDDDILEQISKGSTQTILANCFDNDLVNDISQKTNRKKPLLFSVNGLSALLSYWLQGDWQKHDDYVAPELWFNPNVPYIGHIHLYREERVWEKDAAREFPYGFSDIKKVVNPMIWNIEKMPSGLAVIRK